MKIKATANYCFQELIEGEEYTCGLLFDKEHHLADSIIMKRELENGTTIKATVVENSEIQNVINEFGSKIKAFGSLNLQLRLSSNGPTILEINPRFSGTTSFRIKSGYNDVGRLLDALAFNKPITRSTPSKVHFFRYWDTIVLEEEELQNANIERI
jgi:carbamoyl-phosphate synthase large subunit